MTKKLNENTIRRIIREAVINEISQQTKASAYVRANNDTRNLRGLSNRGEKTYRDQNGNLIDVENQLKRRYRQMSTFGRGLSHDIAHSVDPDREKFSNRMNNLAQKIKDTKDEIQRVREMDDEKLYSKYYTFNREYCLRTLQNDLAKDMANYRAMANDSHGYNVSTTTDGYAIDTPNGRVYSELSGNKVLYDKGQDNRSNLKRLDNLQGITDAMSGLDDELSGGFDRRLKSVRRQQKNVQALRDYDREVDDYEARKNQLWADQMNYDRKPFFKKWFSKRPEDNLKKPQRPNWKPNEYGEFDGYFAHHDPKDYEKDYDELSARKERYKKAKDKYFGWQ